MIIEVTKNGLKIIPQTEEDEVYVEDSLGLRKEGDSIALVRSGDGPYMRLIAKRKP